MLIQLEVNETLAKAHSNAHKFLGSILVWNGKRYELSAQQQGNKYQAQLWASLIGAGLFLHLLNAWLAIKEGDLGMGTVCAVFCIGLTFSVATLVSFKNEESESRQFLDGLLSRAENWKKDALFRKTVVGSYKWLQILTRSLLSLQILPWLLALVVTIRPCSPLNALSSVNPWCRAGNPIGSLSELLMLASLNLGIGMSHLLLWKGTVAQLVIGALHICIGSASQEGLLKFMIHSCKCGGGGEFNLNLYQTCQLLNNCFNNYCSLPVGVSVVTCLLGEIGSSYLALKILVGTSHLPMLVQLVIVDLWFVMLLFHLITFGVAGNVYTLSRSVLAIFAKKEKTGQRSNLRRRHIKSCWLLKVKLGKGNNFMEANTTLVLLNFGLLRVVDLLLLEK